MTLLPLWLFFFGRRTAGQPSRRFTLLARPIAYAVLVPPLRYVANCRPLAYVALIPGNRMPALKNPPPLDAGVPQTVAADFGLFLPSSVTLTGTPVVTIAVASGTDDSPNSRLTSAPEIGTVPQAQGGSDAADAAILQQFTLLGGVTYLVQFTCSRSDGTDEVSGWFHLTGVTPA